MLKHEPLTIRLPVGMRQQLATAARINRRSMNAEVIVLIETGLARQSVSPAPIQPEHVAATAG